MSISKIMCKDCGTFFFYGSDARERDIMAGRTPPERCPGCRTYHRREYSALGCSHTDILQLRTDGTGGLSRYLRPREPSVVIETTPLVIQSFPIEEIVGHVDEKESLLYGLLHGDKRVHLVVGPTGSGKSTWLPFRLVSCPELVRRGPICVTQPRIPATEGPSSFVGKLYYGEDVTPSVGPGLVVGYRHSEVGKSKTDAANRLIFMTDGTLLNELISGEVSKYSVIMIDEAHERSVNIDMILSLLKARIPQYPHINVIIASATVDASSFVDFFGADKVVRYESSGFTYPILDVFADETVAHWPGLSSVEDTFSLFWQEIDEKTSKDELIGPLPCHAYKHLDGYRLRYYPQFENLVFQGIMSDNELEQLKKVYKDILWHEAVQKLFDCSHRRRFVGPDQEISITESVRGSLPSKSDKAYQKVELQNVEKLLYAVVDTICHLVRRDEEEAPRRMNRWINRTSYGWNKLEQPGTCGYILAFFPTTTTLDKCYELLMEKLPSLPGTNQVYRFHREVPVAEKAAVTSESSPANPTRKIILGTNLAETSLTLDCLVYVVDTGLICETYYNPETKAYDYPTILHSQAGCRQRLGRVGRKEPGEGYRLYTREELRLHPGYTTPQITRSSPEQLMLCFASAGLPASFSIQPGALMQPPPHNTIVTAQRELERLQALDQDGDLTSRGSELLKIGANNLLEGVLLCEADRFGCLWEMAIFLSFLSLPDRPGPGGQGKWLSVWDPASGGVFEDQVGDDTSMLALDDNIETRSIDQKGKTPWANPYWKGNVLMKQQALRDGVLDDLELYLRLWQAWFSQGEEEKKQLWAQEYGVSHEALKHVERKMGLDREDTTEKGLLRNFWAFDQKGIDAMKRDVFFEILDKVRYLYSAAVPDRIYKKTGGPNSFQPLQSLARTVGTPVPIQIHAESVWAEHATWNCIRHGIPMSLCNFVANARASGVGKKQKTMLRHIVWLDPEWLDSQFYNVGYASIVLAKRFAPFAEKYLLHHGRWPFAKGDQLCGLSWPMPSISIPSTLHMQQWKVRYGTAIKAKKRFQALVVHVVDWPPFIKKIIYLQMPSGPLVPLEFSQDAPTPCVGDKLEIKLIEKDNFLWAQIPKPAQEEENYRKEASPERTFQEASMTQKIQDDTSKPPERMLSLVSPSRAASPESQKASSYVRPPATADKSSSRDDVDFRTILPVNAIVEAKFVSLKASGTMKWCNVSIPIPGYYREEIYGFPVKGGILEKLDLEAKPNRPCQVKILSWEEKGKLRPHLLFIGWLADAQ